MSVVKITFEASEHRSFLMPQAGPDYCKGSWAGVPMLELLWSSKIWFLNTLKKHTKHKLRKFVIFFEIIMLYIMEKAFYE